MVWTGVLRAALLLSLLSSGIRDVEGQEPVDLTALQHIVKVINVHANKDSSGLSSGPAPGSGHLKDFQYAMAVRITENTCLRGFDGQGLEPLEAQVRAFENTKDVYKGQTIIAAKARNERHSEYQLLVENEGKVIEQLLERKEGRNDKDCVIFYTYNSPCLKKCLNEEADEKKRKIDDEREKIGRKPIGAYRCIYNHLNKLNSLQGPRALVFSQIYREDVNKNDLSVCFKKIADRIPLIQCDNNNRCKRCGQDNQYCVGAGADLAG